MRCVQQYKDGIINNAIDELQSYRVAQKYINQLVEKLAEYEERYTSIQATAYDKLLVMGGEYKDKLVEIAIRWADLEVLIKQKQLEAERIYWQIKDKLQRLTVAQGRVLELYYIKAYSVAQVARIMEYSYEWVKTTKYEGLKKYTVL